MLTGKGTFGSQSGLKGNQHTGANQLTATKGEIGLCLTRHHFRIETASYFKQGYSFGWHHQLIVIEPEISDQALAISAAGRNKSTAIALDYQCYLILGGLLRGPSRRIIP